MDPYRQKILDHYRHPRHFGALTNATHRAALSNPLCGDDVAIALRVARGKIADVRFTGRGCAISTAATSLLTEAVDGQQVARIRRLQPADVFRLFGAPIGPARHTCALLGYDALRQALGHKIRLSSNQKPPALLPGGFR